MSEFEEKEEKHKKISSCVFYSSLQQPVDEPPRLMALRGALPLLESWGKAVKKQQLLSSLFFRPAAEKDEQLASSH